MINFFLQVNHKQPSPRFELGMLISFLTINQTYFSLAQGHEPIKLLLTSRKICISILVRLPGITIVKNMYISIFF